MSQIPEVQHPRSAGFGGLARCPECHSADLEAVLDGTGVNFFCTGCARCWHLELNRVVRIDPATCYGGGHAPECASRFAAAHAADHAATPVTA